MREPICFSQVLKYCWRTPAEEVAYAREGLALIEKQNPEGKNKVANTGLQNTGTVLLLTGVDLLFTHVVFLQAGIKVAVPHITL
jgi:hypothetical protein